MKNIVLIGMPGAGKSTVGVILAKTLGYDFIDTDILMCRKIGSKLQDFIDINGIDEFLKKEEETALSMRCEKTVIATGGSMVLSEAAMKHLKADAITVFLDIPLEELKMRINNIKTRGIALKPGQTIDDIYSLRLPLYRKYSDLTIPTDEHEDADIEAMVQDILTQIKFL